MCFLNTSDINITLFVTEKGLKAITVDTMIKNQANKKTTNKTQQQKSTNVSFYSSLLLLTTETDNIM